MRRRFRSLQFHLALRLALLYLAATAVLVGALAYRAYETAGSLEDRELSLRADDLAGSVVLDPAGNPQLELPPSLSRAYSLGAGADIYAIRSAGGRMVAASPPILSDRIRGWAWPGKGHSRFSICR